MKKWVSLALVFLSLFVYENRMRLFLRDPLGTVLRDGAKEDGAQVFLNYDNDVLLENDHPPLYMTILQHGQPVGAPTTLKCFHYLVCLANGYPAPQSAAYSGARLESMTSKEVRFRDSARREVQVQLR